MITMINPDDHVHFETLLDRRDQRGIKAARTPIRKLIREIVGIHRVLLHIVRGKGHAFFALQNEVVE